MRVSRIHLRNYKSYRDSGTISLAPGFTVIIGKNDAGKTALLEALDNKFQHVPHRSPLTIPQRSRHPDPESSIAMDFVLEPGELKEILLGLGQTLYCPVDRNRAPNIEASRIEEFLNREPATIRAEFSGGGAVRGAEVDGFAFPHDAALLIRYSPQSATLSVDSSGLKNGTNQATLGAVVATALRGRLFRFRAERLHIGESAIQPTTVLQSDAQNLPTVLHALHANIDRFERYTAQVRRVFPHITQVTAPVSPSDGTKTYIALWTIDRNTERDDLAIPLSASGTGISQVLAMLYVVVTAELPQTIVIDEPQSFLHPSAVRELMRILSEHDKHQYIITTHSPVALTAATAPGIILLRRDQHETKVEALDANKATDLRLALMEVGVRLEDIWGADTVVWVEGSTEETCFPIIVSKLLKRPLTGIQISAVLHTSELENKDAERMLRIYQILSGGSAILPSTCGFVLDSERRSKERKEELVKRSGNRLVFLSRRSFENYLLIPETLGALIAHLDSEQQPDMNAKVIKWLKERGKAPEFHDNVESKHEPLTEEWTREVDAPRLLERMFTELTDARVVYRKVEHGRLLTEASCEKHPKQFDEIVDILSRVLGGDATSQVASS